MGGKGKVSCSLGQDDDCESGELFEEGEDGENALVCFGKRVEDEVWHVLPKSGEFGGKELEALPRDF